MSRTSRRQFLKSFGLAAGSAAALSVLPGCSSLTPAAQLLQGGAVQDVEVAALAAHLADRPHDFAFAVPDLGRLHGQDEIG